MKREQINPYKIGMNFYIILIVFTITLLGCKTFEKWNDKKLIKKQAEQMFQTPNLTKNKE